MRDGGWRCGMWKVESVGCTRRVECSTCAGVCVGVRLYVSILIS